MAWLEQKPDEDDPLRELGGVLRSQKSEFRAGIERHFYWDESSGASAGELRYSVDTPGPPGSARAFFATQSQVSTAPSGKLLVTSDTSRLFGFGSSATFLLGSSRCIIDNSSAATIPSNVKIMVLSGSSAVVQSQLTYRIAFVVPGYEVAPQVQLSTAISYITTASTVSIPVNVPQLVQVDTSGFTFNTTDWIGAASLLTLMWRSVGTARLTQTFA